MKVSIVKSNIFHFIKQCLAFFSYKHLATLVCTHLCLQGTLNLGMYPRPNCTNVRIRGLPAFILHTNVINLEVVFVLVCLLLVIM